MALAIRFSPLARALASVGYAQISKVRIEWINSGGLEYQFPMVTDVVFSQPD
jgi:hypothetical protein